MKKTFTLAALAVLIAAGISSCTAMFEPADTILTRHYLLTFENNSAKDICWFVPEHGDVDCSKVTGELPDSLTDYLKGEFYPVEARSASSMYIYEDLEPLCPLEGYHPSDTVSFYVFDRQVLRDSAWTTIKKDELWLAKFTLSAQDLVDAGQTIVYPSK